jgi:single-stranded DNA-binding protein
MYMDYQRINVCLIGNAIQDAVLKQAKESGHAYGDFRLAVRDREGKTHYFPIRCFGKLGQGVSDIKKGTKVFVDGELEMSAFTGEEGTKQMAFCVIAETYRILTQGRKVGEGAVSAKL